MNFLNKINFYNGVLNEINSQVSDILNEDIGDDILELRKEIQKIKNRFDIPNKIFKYIEIEFDGKYELELPKYGLENFNRNLLGRMYFTIDTVNEELKYIDVRTNSFPDTFKLRIFYRYLETNKPQRGKAQLLYKSGSKKSDGPKETIMFEIKKLK